MSKKSVSYRSEPASFRVTQDSLKNPKPRVVSLPIGAALFGGAAAFFASSGIAPLAVIVGVVALLTGLGGVGAYFDYKDYKRFMNRPMISDAAAKEINNLRRTRAHAERIFRKLDNPARGLKEALSALVEVENALITLSAEALFEDRALPEEDVFTEAYMKARAVFKLVDGEFRQQKVQKRATSCTPVAAIPVSTYGFTAAKESLDKALAEAALETQSRRRAFKDLAEMDL